MDFEPEPPQTLRWQRRIFTTLWITYFSYYLCRVNMPVAKSSLAQTFAWDNAQIGKIFSAFTVTYAIGQFVNGQLGDRFGARFISTLGCVFSVLMNLLAFVLVLLAPRGKISPATTLWLLIALWGINGFFQAMGWSPMVKVMTHWFPLRSRGRVMGYLGTCYQFGAAFSTLLAIFLTGYFAKNFSGEWRMVFLVPASLFALVGVFFYVSIRNRPEDAGLPPVDEPVGTSSEPAPYSIVDNLIATLRNPYLWVVAGAFFMLDANRYVFVNWLPSYIDEYARPEDTLRLLGSLGTAMKVCIHPLAGSAGAVLGGWATDRFFGGRRAPVISLFLGSLGFFSVLLTFLNPNNIFAVTSVVALIGFCTYGAHVLMVGHAAQDFGFKQRASGAAGFIDALGYLGASFAGWGAGALIEHYEALGRPGYRITFIYAGISAMLGMILISTLWRVKPRSALAAGLTRRG